MSPKTEAHILNILRRGTVTWHGRALCLKRVRRKRFVRFGKKGQKIYKYYWRCEKCNEWFRNEDDMEVDHIIEVGSFDGNFDTYARKMYCGQKNLMALCIVCHKKKTAAFHNARARYKRKPK